MNSRNCVRPQLPLIIGSVIVCLGCSDKPDSNPTSATAIGVASIDDKPITGGMITIVSLDNPQKRATGILRPDGTFRLAGAPIGKCRVIVDTTSVQMGDPSSYVPVPEKYHALDTTDLTLDLRPGENNEVAIRCRS